MLKPGHHNPAQQQIFQDALNQRVDRLRAASRQSGQSRRSGMSRKSRTTKSAAHVRTVPRVPELDMISQNSRLSNESNGFYKTNEKQGRFYKDAQCTYYSGRLYNGDDMAKTSYSGFSNACMNRTLKSKDTFLNMFPQYRVYRDNKLSTMKKHFYYPQYNVDGKKINEIDKSNNRRKDRLANYYEEMVKVQSMKRVL